MATTSPYYGYYMGGASIAVGAYQAYSYHQLGKMQMQLAKMNASLREDEAQYITEQAELAVSDKREEIRTLMGMERAKGAASGIAVTSKSLMNVTKETLERGEEDVYRIRESAATMAYSKRREAANIIFEGRMAQIQSMARGGQALAGSMIDAAGYMQTTPTSQRTTVSRATTYSNVGSYEFPRAGAGSGTFGRYSQSNPSGQYH